MQVRLYTTSTLIAVVALVQGFLMADDRMVPLPHQVGDAWVLRYHENSGTTRDVTFSIREVERQNDGSLLITHWRKSILPAGLFDPPGKTQPSPQSTHETPDDRIKVNNDGVYLIEDYDCIEKKWVKFDPPRLSLKLPLKEGARWTVTKDDWSSTSTVGKPEKVKVPAGTWEATPVHTVTSYKSGKESVKRTFYYVPGIGGLRTDMDGEIMVELVSFTPAKKKP